MTYPTVVVFPKTITYQAAVAVAHLSQTSLHRAVAVLDRVSEAGDRIEVLADDSRVSRLAGIMALTAYDANKAVRAHETYDDWLGVDDAHTSAVSGLDACSGLLRAISALGNTDVAVMAQILFHEVERALLDLDVDEGEPG